MIKIKIKDLSLEKFANLQRHIFDQYICWIDGDWKVYNIIENDYLSIEEYKLSHCIDDTVDYIIVTTDCVYEDDILLDYDYFMQLDVKSYLEGNKLGLL